VTTLEDSGPGSLREALMDPRPRVVVFRVGGTLRLREDLFLRHPFITVAGQTAPGDGILIRDFGLTILTHDVLIQHLRIRPGAERQKNPENNDGLGLLGEAYGGDVHDVVLDHLSVSWAEDENVSVLGGLRDITVSHCLIAEGLNRSRHAKSTHSAGLLIDDTATATVYRCLLAHNGFRNPVFLNNYRKRNVLAEMVETAVYDWGEVGTEITNYAADKNEGLRLNLVGNVFRAGPSLNAGFPFPIGIGREGNPRLYLHGNMDGTGARDDALMSGIGFRLNREGLRVQRPFDTPAVSAATDSADVWGEVLAAAGATRSRRDAVDARIVEEARKGTGRIIDSPDQGGGYPTLRDAPPPRDSDHDGMPDDWETSRGLNPRFPEDRNDDRNGDGYTNLEEYLFSRL